MCLENLLKFYSQYFETILNRLYTFRMHILYTRTDRIKNTKPALAQYYYHVNPQNMVGKIEFIEHLQILKLESIPFPIEPFFNLPLRLQKKV